MATAHRWVGALGISFRETTKKKNKAPIKPNIKKNNIASNFDEDFLKMELSESPISDWSKGNEFSNWFDKFNQMDSAEGDDDDFEVIDRAEVEESKEQGSDED